MSDKDQGTLQRKKVLDLIDALFGSPDQLADDELDSLYRQIKPDEDPKVWMRAAAGKAAQSYRLRKEKVPYHVQAAFEATKPSSSEDSSHRELTRLVDSLLNSTASPRSLKPAAGSLNKAPDKDLSEQDRAILESLANEISS